MLPVYFSFEYVVCLNQLGNVIDVGFMNGVLYLFQISVNPFSKILWYNTEGEKKETSYITTKAHLKF